MRGWDVRQVWWEVPRFNATPRRSDPAAMVAAHDAFVRAFDAWLAGVG